MPPVDKDAKIPCPTPQHLQTELEALTSTLELGEKEETWEKLERALIRFAGITRGGGYKHGQMYVDGIGRQANGLKIVACMMSDRGRLSGVASDLIQTLAPRLGSGFAPLVSLYLDPLIRLLGRPNKVVLKRTDKCLSTIISHCHLPSIVFELRKGLSDDSVACRRGCALAIERAIGAWDTDIWGEKGLMTLEEIIRKVAADKDVDVRQTAKNIWGLFSEKWPERVDDFSAPLTPITRRRLDIAPAAGQGGPSKPKATVSKKVAPSTAPARAVPTAHAESSSSTMAPARPISTHQRVKSVSTHASKMVDMPAPSRSKATSSAPTSPAKERSDPQVSKPVGQPVRPETLGMPLRSASHQLLPSAATWAHGTSPEKREAWSKPHRPGMPTSFSVMSLPSEAQETHGAARRFPPPARSARPMVASHEGEEPVFGGSAQPLAGPSVLRGPVRVPQHPQQALKIGPAQRRVVTAPILSATASARSLLPASGSTSHLITQAHPRAIRVKQRVEELEEEIRIRSQPSSPVVPMLSPQHTAHLSPLPRKSRLTASTTDSPLLPVLLRSTNSRPQEQKVDDEDLRNVEREEEVGNLTVMDSSAVMAKPPSAEDEGAVVPAHVITAVGTTVTEATDFLISDQVAQIASTDESAAAASSHVDSHKDEDREMCEEQKPEELATELGGELEASNAHHDTAQEEYSEEEEEEIVEERTYQQYNLVPPREADDDHVGPTMKDVTQGEAGEGTEEHDELAKEIPLPRTPPHEAATIPLPPDEEMEPLPAPIAVPKAVWPKEARPAPRVVSQNGVKRPAVAKAAVGVPAKTAPVLRKPPVPPPPVRAKAGPIERKTFKPTTAATRAAATKSAPVTVGANLKASVPAGKTATTASAGIGGTSDAPSRSLTASNGTAVTTNSTSARAPAPRGNIGKGSTAHAMVARSVSAASSTATSSRPPSTIPPKPPVPKANAARVVSMTETTRPVVKQNAMSAAPVKVTRQAIKPSAQVHIPPVRQDKMKRKAPLPSFKPVRAKDKEKAALASSSASAPGGVAKIKPDSADLIKSTSRAKVKPESIPLPASPKEKTAALPTDVPLPQSPSSSVTANRIGQDQADLEGPLRENFETALNGSVQLQRFVSPLTSIKSASMKASPIVVPEPRALSPVLTTSVPPSSPSPTAASFGVARTDDLTQSQSPEAGYGTPMMVTGIAKLVDVPTPGSIPSPFLDAGGRPYNPAMFAGGGYRSPPSNVVTEPTTATLSDDGEDEDDLDGVTTTLGQEGRPNAVVKSKPKVINLTEGDLMEFSASSRPAHGERKDVSTPMKGAEVLLAKFVGTPKNLLSSPGVGARVALSTRDANGGL